MKLGIGSVSSLHTVHTLYLDTSSSQDTPSGHAPEYQALLHNSGLNLRIVSPPPKVGYETSVAHSFHPTAPYLDYHQRLALSPT
jgi:hypothetical protein